MGVVIALHWRPLEESRYAVRHGGHGHRVGRFEGECRWSLVGRTGSC